jgi:hypothetical protein
LLHLHPNVYHPPHLRLDTHIFLPENHTPFKLFVQTSENVVTKTSSETLYSRFPTKISNFMRAC